MVIENIAFLVNVFQRVDPFKSTAPSAAGATPTSPMTPTAATDHGVNQITLDHSGKIMVDW